MMRPRLDEALMWCGAAEKRTPQEVGEEAEDKHTIKIKRFSFWYFDLTNLLI